jgi:hypothetical protein
MRNLLLSIVGAFALLATAGFAGEPTTDLTPKTAVKLIALKANVPENAIEISVIIDGVSKCDKGFEATHVRRVAAIHAVRKADGGQTRSLVFYDLLWNESLGWFMWESRAERAGEAVYIWSELKGNIVNR